MLNLATCEVHMKRRAVFLKFHETRSLRSIKLQVQIDGFDYVGLGSATSKKDAETNAAKDFCGFLIGAGIIPPDSFPDDLFVSCMV